VHVSSVAPVVSGGRNSRGRTEKPPISRVGTPSLQLAGVGRSSGGEIRFLGNVCATEQLADQRSGVECGVHGRPSLDPQGLASACKASAYGVSIRFWKRSLAEVRAFVSTCVQRRDAVKASQSF